MTRNLFTSYRPDKPKVSGFLMGVLLLAALVLPVTTALPSTAYADPQPQCSPTHLEKCSTSKICTDAGGTYVTEDKNNPAYCYFSTGSGTQGSKFAQAARSCSSKPRFLGLVPWYEYLTLADDFQGDCKIVQFQSGSVLGVDEGSIKTASPFLLIALAILQDLVRIAALVTVGFVIFGGFKYITSQGAPEDVKEAQKTIVNALIGLVFAIVAAGIVGFIGNKLG